MLKTTTKRDEEEDDNGDTFQWMEGSSKRSSSGSMEGSSKRSSFGMNDTSSKRSSFGMEDASSKRSSFARGGGTRCSVMLGGDATSALGALGDDLGDSMSGYGDSMNLWDQSLNKASQQMKSMMDVFLDHSDVSHDRYREEDNIIAMKQKVSDRQKQTKKMICIVVTFLLVVVVLVLIKFTGNNNNNDAGKLTVVVTDAPTASPTASVSLEKEEEEAKEDTTSSSSSTSLKDTIQSSILKQEVSSLEDIQQENSVQSKALDWIIANSKEEPGGELLLEQYALACFFFSIQPLGDDNEKGNTRLLRRFLALHKSREATTKEINNRHLFDTTWTVKEDVCQWYGVKCNSKQQITSIDLTSTLLHGTLAPEIFQQAALPALTSLKLGLNMLKGTMPAAGVTNHKLKELHLEGNNDLEGSFFDSMPQLPALTLLDIEGNRFGGTLPDQEAVWSKLSNLEILRITNNNFSGSLPGGISSLTKLEKIYMGRNHFRGSIPTDWSGSKSNWSKNLKLLELDNNQLDGTLPNFIGNDFHHQLEKLSLSLNQFTGHVPSSFGKLTKLKVLDLQLTDLGGTMPKEVCALRSDTTSSGRQEEGGVGEGKHLVLRTLIANCQKPQIECSCCTRCY